MNLGEDRRDEQGKLSPRLLPVLVLLQMWGERNDPCDEVDLVLLLLEAVCSLEGDWKEEEKTASLESLVEKLREMEDGSLAEKFTNYVEKSVKSLTSFMDLFEKSLVGLTTFMAEGDENTNPPPLSMFPFNPVLAVFVSQSVSAFQFLTFSQVVRLHRQWTDIVSGTSTSISTSDEPKQVTEDKVNVYMEKEDFQSALNELTLPSSLDRLLDSEEKETSTEHDPSTNALRLATLHDYFGHKEEGTKAIREAIRFALHENNTKLLQHCLAWLHRLQPFPEEDALSVLMRLTAKAQELHQPLLAGWGRLEESKEMLKLGKDPKQVLQMVLSGGSGESVPVYGTGHEKMAHRGATLATLAKIWDHYGFSHVGQLFCQLQGHVISCDPPPSEMEGRESCVISISLTARHLLRMGEYESVKVLFKSAKRILGSKGSKSQKILGQCIEEVRFDWAVQSGDMAAARRHLSRLQSLDSESSLLRSAILNAALGNYTEAWKLSLKLSKGASSYNKCRALELLAEIECVNGRPSFSLPHLMESLAVCKAHHLSPHTTQLWLAQAQLQLGCHYSCASLAGKCLLHFQACGDVVRIGTSQFLLVQATLLSSHTESGHVDKKDAEKVIPAMEEVLVLFEKASAARQLHEAAIFLDKVYEMAGRTKRK